MEKVFGSGGNVLAGVVSELLRRLLWHPNNGLSQYQRGVVLVISKDCKKGNILSIWEIGDVYDGEHYDMFESDCVRRLLKNPAHLNSRQSELPSSPGGVAIRFQNQGKKIASIYGFDADPAEALLLGALAYKDYLDSDTAVRMIENSPNMLLLNLNRKYPSKTD